MKEHPILFSGPMVRAILEGRKTQTRRIVRGVPEDCDVITCSTLHVDDNGNSYCWFGESGQYDGAGATETHFVARNPYGIPGDQLWVREAWGYEDPLSTCTGPEDIYFKATADELAIEMYKWKPSIHMPRWASRITLEITDIRVQRLQDITEDDARAEGCNFVDPVQWYDGLKPMIDGGYVLQQHRGIPPNDWKNVRPLAIEYDSNANPIADTYDPQSHTALYEFKNVWASINYKRAPWESNPWVWAITFRRIE